MTYYKRKYPKKKRYARKPRRRTTASKALSLAKKTYRMCKPENKFLDFNSLAISPNYTGLVNDLDIILPGDGYDEREGREVVVKSVSIKGRAYLSTAATKSEDLSLYLVRENDSTILQTSNIGSVLFNINNDASLLTRIIDTANHFTVLKRWTFSFNKNGRDTVPLNIYHKMYHKITWDKDDTLGTGTIKGGLKLVSISSAPLVAHVVADCSIRVKFCDA